jgi:murein DD-endopeptidase MepM/ murein hydrolase activator NlpD
MQRLELFYPAKPFIVSQGWGILNPAYEQFGFNRHNGIDFLTGYGTILRAPFDCTVVQTGNKPTGSGIYLTLLSKNRYSFDDGVEALVLVDLLHCEKLYATEGDELSVGDIIAVADNTGFSTGPHTHMQVRRLSEYPGTPIDKNAANNSIDPWPYFGGSYAEDAKQAKTVIVQAVSLIERIKAWLQGRSLT